MYMIHTLIWIITFNVDFVENIVVSISKNLLICFNIPGKNTMYLEIHSSKLNVCIAIYWSIPNQLIIPLLIYTCMCW